MLRENEQHVIMSITCQRWEEDKIGIRYENFQQELNAVA